MQPINPTQIKPKAPRLTGSQSAFLDFPRKGQCKQQYTVYQEMSVGGWASGKSWSGIQKALFLTALYPGNEGMVCRLHGSDLTSTMCEEFIKQIPEGWVRKIRNRGRSNQVIHFWNGSIIYFSHVRDANAAGTKTRRTGHNLGWFLLEQAEEITREEWMALCGRLRNPRAKMRYALGNANPAGSDWIQQDFFPHWIPLDPSAGVFYRTYVNGNKIGIHIDSEENRISNGGFVDDGFYDNVIANSTKEFIDRYVHASFLDFSGRVYKEYSLTSVHNIEPLASVPASWECIGGIDVGGVCAWSVLKTYVDRAGNLIIAGEFDKATPLVLDVVQWIKSNMPWQDNRTTFVIDPENKVAAADLSEHGIFARPAFKSVIANIQRVSGYMHLVKGKPAPQWLIDDQPALAARIEREGCPRVFVYNTCGTFRKEHNDVLWDEKKVNQIKKTNVLRFDSVDTFCYIAATRPEARQLALHEDPRLSALRKISLAAAREFEEDMALMAEHNSRVDGAKMVEMFSDGDNGDVFAGARRAAATIEWD